MRVPVWLAWVLLLASFSTAGLLRQFHDHTPHSPYVSARLGSLLFAIVLLLALVFVREARVRRPGAGVRLGALVPLMLMLFLEKWISISWYNPLFYLVGPRTAADEALDALFALFAGGALLVLALLLAFLSLPTRRRTWRMARLGTLPPALAGLALVTLGSYAALAAVAAIRGVPLRFELPRADRLLVWIVIGQAVIAFAEELYYRGLLLLETHRLAPRLGVRSQAGRRWLALLTTSFLFGAEHIRLGVGGAELLRQVVFSVSLGLLFGMLVFMTRNLTFVALLHAWINWTVLGVVPRLVDAQGEPWLPSGSYVGVALVLAFGLAYAVQVRNERRAVKT